MAVFGEQAGGDLVTRVLLLYLRGYRDLEGREQDGFECLVKLLKVADRDRTERVAVIRILEIGETLALGPAGVVKILKGDFQRRLDRARAVAGKQDVPVRRRHQFREPGRQFDGGRM